MRNLIISLTFLLSFGLTYVNEPIDDVIDAFAGGTNTTYSLSIDSVAGASGEREDDDDEDDEYEYEYEDEED